MVDDLRIFEHFSSSAHNMIDFELVVTTGGLDTVIYKYDFKQGNYKAIKNVLSEVNWSEIFLEKNTLECYKFLSDKLGETITSYVPVKKSNIKKTCLWLNIKVKRLLKKRNKIWKRYRCTKSHADYERYKTSRKQVTKELRKARKVFEEKLAQDVTDNPKSFYRYMCSRTKSKDKVGPLKDLVGNVIADDKGMCDMLNDFFGSAFTTENIADMPEV